MIIATIRCKFAAKQKTTYQIENPDDNFRTVFLYWLRHEI